MNTLLALLLAQVFILVYAVVAARLVIAARDQRLCVDFYSVDRRRQS